jgi:hypothetical protein
MKRLLCGILVAARCGGRFSSHTCSRAAAYGRAGTESCWDTLEKSVSARLEDRRSKCMSVIGRVVTGR